MERAPTPFTADQIRNGCAGMRTRTLHEAPGEPGTSRVTVTEFRDVDDDGAELVVHDESTDGEPIGEPVRRRVEWETLRRHAEFPIARTEIADDLIATPLGELATRRYTVTGDGRTNVFWFALDHPGAPVRSEVRDDHGVASVSTIIAIESLA
jgi:hypothetical protein